MLKCITRYIKARLPVSRKHYNESLAWYARQYEMMVGELQRARQQGTLSVSAMGMVFAERDAAKKEVARLKAELKSMKIAALDCGRDDRTPPC